MFAAILKYFNLFPTNLNEKDKNVVFQNLELETILDDLKISKLQLSGCENFLIGESEITSTPVLISLENNETKIFDKAEKFPTDFQLSTDKKFFFQINDKNERFLFDIEKNQIVEKFDSSTNIDHMIMLNHKNKIFFLDSDSEGSLFNLENFKLENISGNLSKVFERGIRAYINSDYIISISFPMKNKKQGREWRIYSILDDMFLSTDNLINMTDVKISNDGETVLSINYENELFLFSYTDGGYLEQIFKKSFNIDIYSECLPTLDFKNVFIMNYNRDLIICFSIEFNEVLFSFEPKPVDFPIQLYKRFNWMLTKDKIIVETNYDSIQIWDFKIPEDLRNFSFFKFHSLMDIQIFFK